MPNVSPIPEAGHMAEPPGARPRGTRFWQRIRGQIILVLAVALIPTLLIQAYVFNEWRQSRREGELETNLQLARAVEKTFGRFIQGVLHQELAIGQALAMQVESSGGVFTIKSSKGQGTTIGAFWDLSRFAE